MILVGKSDILSRIDNEIKHFKDTNTCELDYVILMDDEWAELMEYLGCPNTKQSQFYHKGVALVRDGYHFDVKHYEHYNAEEAKYE
jgi:hypothetical protein